MTEIVLWRCAPLSAQITEAACTRNATTARKTPPYLRGMLASCVGCPGVRALNRKPCDVLDAATVIANSKALRPDTRQTAGSPRLFALRQNSRRPKVASTLPLQAQFKAREEHRPKR